MIARLRQYFITGLLVWLPMGVTVWVLLWLVGSLDSIFLGVLATLEAVLPGMSRIAEPLRNVPSADFPDTAVLACTHFPPLAEAIQKALGPAVRLVDSAATTATAVEKILDERGLRRPDAAPDAPVFLTTDAPERFAKVGGIFLGRPLLPANVELVAF